MQPGPPDSSQTPSSARAGPDIFRKGAPIAVIGTVVTTTTVFRACPAAATAPFKGQALAPAPSASADRTSTRLYMTFHTGPRDAQVSGQRSSPRISSSFTLPASRAELRLP